MKELSADNVPAEISSFSLEYAIVSDIGKRRTENQDSFARARTSSSHLFIVADGMGGARGGATASALAVNVVGRKAFPSDGVITPESLRKALELANHVVHAFGTRDEELAGMGTTVVAAAITGDEIVIGFVGDSRIYFWRDHQITQVSRDHTLVQELVDSGALAEHEATNHPISHMLTRSLGPMSTVNAETMSLSKKILPGDTILLCCDGLYNLVTDEEIKNILGEFSVQDAADKLVALANERGGTDNITVQVVRVLPERKQEEPSDNPGYIIEQQYSRTEKDLKIQVDFDRIDVTLAKIMVEPQLALPVADDFGDFPDYDDLSVQDDTDNDAMEIEAKADVSSEPLLVNIEESSDTSTTDEEVSEDGEVNIPDDTSIITAEDEIEISAEDNGNGVSVSIEQLPPAENESKGIPRKIIILAALFGSLALVIILLVFVIRVGINSIPATKSDVQKSLELAQQEERKLNLLQEHQEMIGEKDIKKDIKVEPNPEISMHEKLYSQEVVEKKTITYVSAESVRPKDLTLSEEEKNKISKLIAESSDFLIPATPAVESPKAEMDAPGSSLQNMEPISWNAEKSKIEALQAQPGFSEVKIQESDIAQDEAKAIDVLQPEELSLDEKRQIIERKKSLRDKVFDLDAKLKVFGFRDIEESNNVKAQLENTLTDIYAAIDYKIKEKNYIQKTIEEFQTYQTQIKDRGVEGVSSLVRVIEQSQELIALYDAYNVSSSEYQQSLNEWKKNSSDVTLSAKMVNKGNAIRVTLHKLTNGLDDYLNLKLGSLKENYYDIAMQIQNLEHRRDRINRQIGFVLAYSPNLSPRSRMVLQRELLDNRRLQEKEYKALSEQVSDEEESLLINNTIRSNPIIP